MIHSQIALVISGDIVAGIVLDAVIRLPSHANGTRDRACYKCPAGGRVEYSRVIAADRSACAWLLHGSGPVGATPIVLNRHPAWLRPRLVEPAEIPA